MQGGGARVTAALGRRVPPSLFCSHPNTQTHTQHTHRGWTWEFVSFGRRFCCVCVGGGCARAGSGGAGGGAACPDNPADLMGGTPLALSSSPCTDDQILATLFPPPALGSMGPPVIISFPFRVPLSALLRLGFRFPCLPRTHFFLNTHYAARMRTHATHTCTGNLRTSSGTWTCARPTYVFCVGGGGRRRRV